MIFQCVTNSVLIVIMITRISHAGGHGIRVNMPVIRQPPDSEAQLASARGGPVTGVPVTRPGNEASGVTAIFQFA